MKETIVNVIGAGLAGSESALFLANHGIKVNLFEMKPNKKTPAHKLDGFCELVCSNSLKSEDVETASGLLKAELLKLGSSVLKVAESCRVPAGNSLSVDRNLFSKGVTEQVKQNKNINVVECTIEELNLTEPTILATGPLTDEKLMNNLKKYIGGTNCYFYDAIAPIVTLDSIDMSRAFWANRYNKGEGEGDYLNLPMNKEEYLNFYNELINAQTVELKEFEKVFEGCMPIEVMAKRGIEVMRFGPLKPVGLYDKAGEKPYAVVQLRKENETGTMLNIVGFQTNLTFSEQRRVFSLIPALKNAEFIRYGVMHRNSFINAPLCLNACSQLKEHKNIFIAGQLSGVEGYVESIGSGLVAAINMYRYINKKNLMPLPPTTCMGAILNYIANSASPFNFQPMNANYGIIVCEKEFKDKKEKKKYIYENSMQEIDKFLHKCFLVENNKS